MKKTGARKSHATVPLKGLFNKITAKFGLEMKEEVFITCNREA